MKRLAALALAAALVLTAGFVVLANIVAPADVATSARLTTFVDPARDTARSMAGPAGGWPLPLRLAQFGCSPDGNSAVLAFETSFPVTRAYVAIGLVDPADVGTPGVVTVIAPLSRAEFERSDQTFAATLTLPCE